ncbi:hypothetical protein pipiens_001649 [Culex pipiens pipiens]|uniref:Uncharacterized protein n=1 Tax=Culex pipiens pipiens TaxID=38569 RepID=A0ABD1CDZ7_CULPP
MVPRLNKPIPSVHILTDPFDVPSWVMIVAVLTSLALLRTSLGNRKTIVEFLQNICDILGSFTIGSDVICCREMERWLNAVCILLSVVVINAYQSMIISYLLCPRFYPELDTLELMNESCCWDSDEQASLFQHYNACPDPYMYAMLYGDEETGISILHRMLFCSLLDSWTKEITDVNPPLAITSGKFRWSKQTLNEWPMMGWTAGDAVVTERILVLSAIFFAEGALDRFHSPRASWQGDTSRNILGMPTNVGELSLVWGVYLTVNAVPLLAWIQGECVITERMTALSGQYFAEGALSSMFEAEFDRPADQQSLLKPTSNEMLSIVWRIYGAGMALAVVVFITELAQSHYVSKDSSVLVFYCAKMYLLGYQGRGKVFPRNAVLFKG